MLATRALVTFKCQMTEAEAKKSSFPAKQKERGRLRQRGRRDTGLALGTPTLGKSGHGGRPGCGASVEKQLLVHWSA